jgi:hypothetical protein
MQGGRKDETQVANFIHFLDRFMLYGKHYVGLAFLAFLAFFRVFRCIGYQFAKQNKTHIKIYRASLKDVLFEIF